MRRWIVAVLVTSLAPLVAGPASASVPDATEDYAAWIRAQANPASVNEAEAAIERALTAARVDAPHALDAFTEAFAEAYEAQHPALSLADLFALSTAPDAPLFQVLHQRAQHLGRAAALMPLSWRTAVSPVASGCASPVGGGPLPRPASVRAPVRTVAPLAAVSSLSAAFLLQILSDAAPRGP